MEAARKVREECSRSPEFYNADIDLILARALDAFASRRAPEAVPSAVDLTGEGFWWLAEVPEQRYGGPFYIKDHGGGVSGWYTNDPNAARKWPTKAACAEWCASANEWLTSHVEAREHGFGMPRPDRRALEAAVKAMPPPSRGSRYVGGYSDDVNNPPKVTPLYTAPAVAPPGSDDLERAAKVCASMADDLHALARRTPSFPGGRDKERIEAEGDAAKRCAAAIRALSGGAAGAP